MHKKIIRSVCYFSQNPREEDFQKLDQLEKLFVNKQFIVQTKRLVCPDLAKAFELDKVYPQKGYFLGVGSFGEKILDSKLEELLKTNNIAFNLDLSDSEIDIEHVEILLKIIKINSAKTFNFAYVFNNPASSPFFPAANYLKNGFSIGLQPTDLAEGCNSLQDWFKNMQEVWSEINNLMKDQVDFLGIDSSIAPFDKGSGSFINFVRKISGDFDHSVTTDIYTQITELIKNENPRPIGLCGLMFPALEDFELTEEYEKGNFSIERNIYLSLHSGLGIDTYPLGVDEKPERILEVLKLVQALSNKYKKPLSVRFVSDGSTKVGEKTDFKNQYLKDVSVRKL